MFRDLVFGCKDAKRQRCKASIVKIFTLSGRGSEIFRVHPSSATSYHLLPHRGEGRNDASLFSLKKRAAFTLAEVLITLGIIGVVAAMTMPVLIQKHQNQVLETRLKKFYTTINQAVLTSEAFNGDKDYWYTDSSLSDDEWFKKYIGKYMNIMKYETDSYALWIYFPDGSVLAKPYNPGRADWLFYPGGKKCVDKYSVYSGRGVCAFVFNFQPHEYKNDDGTPSTYWKHTIGKGFEPLKAGWNGTIEQLENACYNNVAIDSSVVSGAYCTAVIQYYGWKIPKNYKPHSSNKIKG